MKRLTTGATRIYNKAVDALFACAGCCLGLDRFYWFNLAAGLRG